MKKLTLIGLCLLAACDALPRDPEGTSKRILETRQFSVSLTDAALRGNAAASRLITQLEKQTGARAIVRSGSVEPTLQAATKGQVDLVIGQFRRDSPWRTEIAFGPPLASFGPKDDPIELKAAVRNGENRWLMTVERASRAISSGSRAQ